MKTTQCVVSSNGVIGPGGLCPLNCQNGGSCVAKSVFKADEYDQEEWECDCPSGFDGNFCEFPSSLPEAQRRLSVTCPGNLLCL